MTDCDVNINMSSPINRNARYVPKRTELSGDVQNSIHVKNPCSPKKEKGMMDKQIKNTLKPLVCFSDAQKNNSLPHNMEKSYIQTPSSIISKETSHEKEVDSGVSSCGCVESIQCNTSDISTKKLTKQKNQYSPESLKENRHKNTPQKREENVGQLNSQMPLENKNVKKNDCEVQTRAENYETPESLPLNTSIDSSNDNVVDKKKERRKMVKKLAKDEKRKQRELEYKKNLQYPKGQRIQVIDHNTFNKILKDAQPFHNENKKSDLSSEEFPTLNVLKRNRFPVMPCQNSSVHSDTEKSKVQDKMTNNMGQCMKISETQSVISAKTVNKTGKVCSPNKLGTNAKGSLKKIGKLPKKRDPIQIDILQCIKMVKSKDAVIEPRKKPSALERRNENSLLSGNELDSSNPQRSRGKKREKPKKKRPTRLKLVILHERELAKQLKQLRESGLPQAEVVHFGTETSMNLQTAQRIKVEQAEKAHFDTEMSMNLLTACSIKLEQGEPYTNVSDNEVVKTVLGSSNLLIARDIKLEKMEPVTNVSDNEVVDIIQKIEDISNNDGCKYEVPSSESKTAGAVINQVLKAEDDSQAYMPDSLHITNKEPCTEGRVPHVMPYLVYSASEILTKEKKEISSSVKESCCIVNLEQDQHSVATAGDDLKSIHNSSNAVKHEALLSSQIEQCIGSLETVSFTDSDMCNKPNQNDCRKFRSDEICHNSEDQNETMQTTKIHSRKFRPYCDHFITPEINSSVTTLLQDIVKFHDRQFERDPVKANARRRHIVGLREVLKFLNLKRLKLIIIAPDMELIQGKGGICDIVEQLKEGARNQEIPYVFALQRRILGKITFKKVPVSCIGIINYDGTEKNFHSLVSALQIARAQYQEVLRNVCLKETHSEEVDINKQVIEAALSKLTETSSTPCPEQSHLDSEIIQKWEE